MHESYMQRCLKLAAMGLGTAAPNPLVGSVVVYNNEIIGEGYHENYGGPHAEVNAINAVKDPELLKKATLYVNLEPCAHHGKTPPCANLIIEKNIPKVVIGCIDSYSEVAGKGIKKLEAAGVEVTLGVLQKESEILNRRFFTFHNQQRPYVILKWAESADGFMDINRDNHEKGTYWITEPQTQTLVHQWRAEESGILVGRRTVANDNPSLNCRAFKGKDPIRIILDPNLALPYHELKIGTDGIQTLIINKKSDLTKGHLSYIKCRDFSIEAILKILFDHQIQSVIIEGGQDTLNRFIQSNIWDEARILQGRSTLKNGLSAPTLKHATCIKTSQFGNDTYRLYHRH